MVNLERLTKAEIIKLYEENSESLKRYKENEEKLKKQVQADLSFKQTEEEAKSQAEKQARKDYIKRMTNGRWTSEEKYQEYQKQLQAQGGRKYYK